jgi:uncharacterized membrane protein YecN with MAPEG domain
MKLSMDEEQSILYPAPPKPWPISHPKPRRLPRREYMTAILGLNCSDGILMLSDTEETIRPMKSGVDKLERFVGPYGTAIVGGAGDGDLIDFAVQELANFFKDKINANADILSELNNFAKEFFSEVIGTYKGFPSDFIPTFEMLMAINSRSHQKTWMFHWLDNRVLLISDLIHKSIGSGIFQTRSMLRDVQFPVLWPCKSMLVHGIRIMMHAKSTVQGVGGRTEARALLSSDGATYVFGSETIRVIEELIEEIERFGNRDLYSLISDAPGISKEDIEKILRKLSVYYRSCYKRYKKIFEGQK